MKKVLVATAVVAVLAGCQSNDTVKDVQQIDCFYPDAPTTEAPRWVCDVMPTGIEMGAVGYAKKSVAGLNIMRDVATNDARARLAQQFETNVNTLFKQATTANIASSSTDGVSEEVNEYLESVIKNVTSRTLSNSKVIVTQRSPGGGLYTLVGMDKATYDENIAKVVAAAGNKDPELWNKFNSKKAAEELDAALSSLQKL
ncbi:LPP20 family lipoprotein [Shewanella sp. 1CM18E]|uniref:LPP20 family lipoprotein n=1 Tax=Shewanella sp. 1CM18E TaxID=2929169 RepID=UPI0020C0A28D|nr:LPP20 family lipoprotein [Shewanella sp. 1CM18E]MCK8046835.1 LPP20 family lipoprotein [Shewanella sp. 1CM18E]